MEKRLTKNRLCTRRAALWTERSSWDSHWQEIVDNLLPRSGRFFYTDRNKGDKRNRLYNDIATKALNIQVAGMFAGSSSPARPWFRLTIPDQSLAKQHAVRVWLDDYAELVRTILNRSNAYRILPMLYEECGAFGTGAALQMTDYESVSYWYPMTVGEYAIGQDYKGRVNTFYRQFQATVGQMVREFGKKNCSQIVQNMWDRGSLDDWVTITHAIESRDDRDVTSRLNKNFRYASYYFDESDSQNIFLRESGFRDFRVLAPRWQARGGDIYGHSPGMQALGEISGLQLKELRKHQAIDYQSRPPLQGPDNTRLNLMPGAYNNVSNTQSGSVKTLFDAPLNISHLKEDIAETKQSIWQTFFADIFLMVANSSDKGKTATEIAELREEKMLMLGPVLERMHHELHAPMVTMVAKDAMEAGIVPPPPKELDGIDLQIEFVSVLAQAQRMIPIGNLDRFITTVGTIAAVKPEALDRVNADDLVDAYSDMLGIDPDVIVSVDKAFAIRQSRAEVEAQQQEMAAQQQQAETAATLAKAQTGDNRNALQDVLNQYSGYGSPSPLEL
ncbi:portal protein [Prosthecochloris sp.]|uniref:portal protein n=1 Tax=Prosthecochloris sp. TaxID=290513 RepID=UPI0025802979|nr:portal protein [Prosthecochloris sp.]